MNTNQRKSLFVGSPWDRIHDIVLLAFLLSPLFGTASIAACDQTPDQRPNVLFIIADDASPHFGNAYGCTWVKTPNIDKLASRGLVFDQCYTPTAKCAPSRSAILTGRNPWQLEDAANHQSQFPVKFVAFSEALSSAGIYVGGHGKIWGPGSALTEAGTPRSFGFLKSQTQKDFGAFLQNRPTDKPFFYWFGSHNPHRGYKKDSGLGAGKKLSDIDRVPKFWPDNEIVRSDMLDYALEVEAFDTEVGEILRLLEASGEASRTLVLVTSDNGMPFPRSKGHNYEISNRLPMVACWPTGIADPGRRVPEYVSFIDLAPTFLELFGIEHAKSGMASITGRSFVNLLKGQTDSTRDYVILGRERNDVLARPGTSSGLGYPVRAIREGKLFYIHNFESDRWPCGNPDLGLIDTDASPTKSWLSNLPTSSPYWQWSFGKRPKEELYNLENDPDCIKNLADTEQYQIPMKQLREKLFRQLTIQSDPRVLGQGSIFDLYESPKAKAAVRRQAK